MNNFMSNRLNSYLPNEKVISLCETDFGIKIKHEFTPYGLMGGDLWGIRPLSDNEVAIYLFDFLGHGETAGKEAAFLYSIMNDMFKPGIQAGKFITKLNRRFCNSPGFQRYATMFLTIYNKSARTFNYSSAAHQPFYHISLNKEEPANITKPSFILGSMDDAIYESNNIKVNSEDLFLTYSDALPEARIQANGNLFDNKLQQTISETHGQMKKDRYLCADNLFNATMEQLKKTAIQKLRMT